MLILNSYELNTVELQNSAQAFHRNQGAFEWKKRKTRRKQRTKKLRR
jgi:hypothetical protein